MSFRRSLLAGALFMVIAPISGHSTAKAPKKAAAKTALVGDEASPVVRYGPAPSWVRREAVPPLNPEHKEDPFQFLLSSSQERLTPAGVENVVEYVVQPLNQAGVQALGTVVIPWNVHHTNLTLNAVEIGRDGESIDALRRQDVSVIRRESKLEQSTLTGIRSVVLPVRDLRVGDALRVQFTYTAKPRRFGATEEIQDFSVPIPVGRVVRRFIVSEDLPVRWSIDPSLKQPAVKRVPEGVETVFEAEKLTPATKRQFVPQRYQHKLVQVTAYTSWQQVADTLAPLFNGARNVSSDSAVAKLADKIAAEHSHPARRMVAALRTAQDDVRYVALLLGDGDYTPMSADQVWAGRFGDCKGKTALLLALLDRMNIRAEPMLVSTKYDDGFDKRLPTLAMFDHVIVRARIGNETYYLDGTAFAQRTLDELKHSDAKHGLPLTPNTAIVITPDVVPSLPLQQTELTWDARNGVLGDVPFEATLTLRGQAAAEMRTETQYSSDRKKLLETLKSKVSRISNDSLEHVATETDAPDGSYVVRFKGKAEIDWRPVNGMKGNRMELDQTSVSWDGEFDRDEGDGKELPVLMAFPHWERTTETVLLPDGGKGYWLDAKPIDEAVAATRIRRSVTMANGAVTAVSDFVRLRRELAASDARSAKEKLEKISGDYAYIVSKRKLKLPD